MFKKIFQSIRRTFAGGHRPGHGSRANTRRKPAEKSHNLLERISAPAPADRSGAPASASRTAHPRSPMEQCGISPGMSTEEIKARLALLYRRYNRATSSLDEKVRSEAVIMLDAIVDAREKFFGPI